MVGKVNKESLNIIDNKINEFKKILPEVFTEDKINFEKLKELLGDKISTEEERYFLNWAGKKEAIENIKASGNGTLVPAKNESVKFEESSNLFIEGDNLEVLKLLQKSYSSKIKMIYIDPPYNTGEDFIYDDNYKDNIKNYLEKTGQVDSEGNKLTTNTEANGRFHSDWLTMMYPRLYLARNLLKEDGVICVSIGEKELANLKIIMNEIFGEENYRNTILIRRYNKNLNRQFIDQGLSTLNVGAEYILIYSFSKEFKMNAVYREPSEERKNNGYWKGFWNSADRPTMRYNILGVTPEEGQWKWSKEVALEAVDNYQEYLDNYADKMSLEEYWEKTGKTKKFIRRNPKGQGKNQGVDHWIPPSEGILRSSNWTDLLASGTLSSLDLEFDNPKNVDVIKELIRLCCDEENLILDFFAGSGTTAQAMLELNQEEGTEHKFITVQLPEKLDEIQEINSNKKLFTISDIARERIKRVINGYADNEAINDGFKVFKLDKSNYKIWEELNSHKVTVEELRKQLTIFQDSLIDDYKDIDVIYEVMIKEGYNLNANIERLNNKNIYKVTSEHKYFYITFAEKVNEEVLNTLDYDQETTFICLDNSINDQVKINLSLEVNLKTI